MTWMELSLNTTAEAVDWISTLLATIDYVGELKGMPVAAPATQERKLIITKYVEPSSNNPSNQNGVQPLWAFTIYLYLSNNVGVSTRIQEINNLLSPLHRTGLASVPQIALVEKPAQVAEPSPFVHQIGQRFVVDASDTTAQAEVADKVVLKLSKTLTFGSGLHPTTVVSLQLLERHIVPGMYVLDLGAGSGILSVAMAKLGAQVLALDNDLIAVQATQDAVLQNGVEQRVTVMEGSLGRGNELGHWLGGKTADNVPTISATATFDLIVANVLARIHVTLAEDFQRALRRTDTRAGLVITAGFTTDYEDEVNAALIEAGLEAVDCERFNEWVALAHRLKA
ncbi:MAG: 50S ribosomal protein L11 methyltransferase [Chroococcidiopsidaceae cyanobacterium CP_BM_ER_R8_30]|nr:50S ribosomal protein L11 methyltransferase [Chroococcidiopsidaceae cyanobacterium CP_BM_ER_R8_30]